MPAKGHKLSKEARLKVSLAQKGRKHTPQEGFRPGNKGFKNSGMFKKGVIPWNKGLTGVYSKDVLKKMGAWQKGREHNLESIKKRVASRKGYKHSEETKLKISKGNLGKKSPSTTGEKAWNWKGGITPEVNKIRSSIEYSLWKNSVFSRDNWICQKTGVRGGKLTAHHIQNFSHYPELRFAINNGVTLSQEAHKEFHKIYSKRNNTREQIEEFLCQK